jgi:hypothetical protein
LVMRAVRSCVLRCRLQSLTWQELTAALPKSLRNFWLRNTTLRRDGETCVILH